jgi:hypothetical protein
LSLYRPHKARKTCTMVRAGLGTSCEHRPSHADVTTTISPTCYVPNSTKHQLRDSAPSWGLGPWTHLCTPQLPADLLCIKESVSAIPQHAHSNAIGHATHAPSKSAAHASDAASSSWVAGASWVAASPSVAGGSWVAASPAIFLRRIGPQALDWLGALSCAPRLQQRNQVFVGL